MPIRDLKDKIEDVTDEQWLNIRIGVLTKQIERYEKQLDAYNAQQQRLCPTNRVIGLPQAWYDLENAKSQLKEVLARKAEIDQK